MIVAELDVRSRRKHSIGTHQQWPTFEIVQIAHDQQQIGCFLDWQKSATRYVYACEEYSFKLNIN